MLKTSLANLRTHQLSTLGYWAVFGFTVLLACYARFQNSYARMQWFDDSARDMMVAQRIGESGRYQNIRPLARASYGFLNNSTVYYNLLAFLWSFGHSQTSLTFCFTLLGIFSLLAGWEIGRQIGGKWLGLACLFVLAVNSTLAQIQISVYQRNLLPSLALVIVMISIWVWNCPSMRRLALLLAVFTFGVLIHYSLLTFMPVVFGLTIRTFFKNTLHPIKKTTVLTAIAVACYAAWQLTTGSNLLQLIFYTGYTTSQQIPFNKVVSTHTAFFYDFLMRTYWQSAFPYAMTIIWVVVWATGAVSCVRARRMPAIYLYLTFLSSYLFVHVVFWSSRLFSFGYEYMIHYQPLVLILLPIATWSVAKLLGKIPALIALEVICVFCFVVEFPVLHSLYQPHKFLQEASTADVITQRISKDFEELNATGMYHQFTFVDYTSWAKPGWFAPAFLTFFEQRDGRTYSTLSSHDNNLEYHFADNPGVLYLLCSRWRSARGVWTTSAADQAEMCLKPFLEKYLQSYLGVDQSKVESELFIDSSSNALNINVFRIKKKN